MIRARARVLMGRAKWELSRKTSAWAWCNEGIVIGARARGVYEHRGGHRDQSQSARVHMG